MKIWPLVHGRPDRLHRPGGRVPEAQGGCNHLGLDMAIIEDAEKYQLTLDDKQDARNEFLEAVSYLAQSQKNKNGSININTGGGQDDSQT